MIWQENVGKIVMVTPPENNRRIIGQAYWLQAANKPLIVDNFEVTLNAEREHTVYVYRLLTVLNKNSKNAEERKLHHFHFAQWPDHGVPDSTKLVNYYRKVKSQKCDQNGPIVVHCSAGIGRTGTFIAIDALYEHGNKVGYVNVMEYIKMMRKDRMNMVQTYEQYETVFEALLELFTVPETSIPKHDFGKFISDQEYNSLPRNQKMYKVEFQRLEALRPLYPPSAFTAALMKENISKNSTRKILPLTQCPLEETVVDFWTMVYDHNSTIVVLLDQLNTNAPLWLERQEVLEFDHFTIMHENASNPDELKVTLTSKENDQMTITVFTTSELKNETMLPSNILSDLLIKVKDCREINQGPLTVICSDGCSKSGLFVALELILEKMEIDDEIDVFQVIRTMQLRRPEFSMNWISMNIVTSVSRTI